MTSLAVHNFTQDELLVQLPVFDKSAKQPELLVVSPLSFVETTVHERPLFLRWKRHVILSRGSDTKGHIILLDRNGYLCNVKDVELPWTVYWVKESKALQRLVVIPKRDMSTFLSDMDDSLSLGSLCLPGTHDTMAFYGWPFAQCQSRSTPLDVQLRSGIRVIDVRLALVNGRLIAHHGIINQRTPFQDILTTVHSFLNNPATARETLVMTLKQEDFNTTPPPTFSAAVHAEILQSTGGMAMWFLENRIPNLGEVRGKVIMLSRFGGDGAGWDNRLEGMGIHPPTWPDSLKSGFSYQLKDTTVRMHDWYNIPSVLSIPEKVQLSTAVLVPTSSEFPPAKTLNFTYLSAGSVPLALPPTVAKGFGWPQARLGIEGVNSRVCRWMLQQLLGGENTTSPASPGNQASPVQEKEEMSKVKANSTAPNPVVLRGWAMMDYFMDPEDSPIIPLFVEFNYLGRAGTL